METTTQLNLTESRIYKLLEWSEAKMGPRTRRTTLAIMFANDILRSRDRIVYAGGNHTDYPRQSRAYYGVMRARANELQACINSQ